MTRLGAVLSPPNKDAALFPEPVNGQWIMLHRPVSGGQEHIWYIGWTGGFACWSAPGVLIRSEADRGGMACASVWAAPPLRTEKGWLLIYHGVKEMGNRPVYRLGLALLDLQDPRKAMPGRNDGFSLRRPNTSARG